MEVEAPAMFAIFGLGAMELIVLAAIALLGIGVAGIVFVAVFAGSRKSGEGGNEVMELRAEVKRLRDEVERLKKEPGKKGPPDAFAPGEP